jgi:hypothetical protein
MYVYIYIYIHIHTHIHTHRNTHTHVHTYRASRSPTHTYTHTHRNTHTHVHTYRASRSPFSKGVLYIYTHKYIRTHPQGKPITFQRRRLPPAYPSMPLKILPRKKWRYVNELLCALTHVHEYIHTCIRTDACCLQCI